MYHVIQSQPKINTNSGGRRRRRRQQHSADQRNHDIPGCRMGGERCCSIRVQIAGHCRCCRHRCSNVAVVSPLLTSSVRFGLSSIRFFGPSPSLSPHLAPTLRDPLPSTEAHLTLSGSGWRTTCGPFSLSGPRRSVVPNSGPAHIPTILGPMDSEPSSGIKSPPIILLGLVRHLGGTHKYQQRLFIVGPITRYF